MNSNSVLVIASEDAVLTVNDYSPPKLRLWDAKGGEALGEIRLEREALKDLADTLTRLSDYYNERRELEIKNGNDWEFWGYVTQDDIDQGRHPTHTETRLVEAK